MASSLFIRRFSCPPNPSPSKPNTSTLSGFSMEKLAASRGSPLTDPWRENEAWRSQGHFTRRNRFRNALPGLGIATTAFIAYLAYEQLTLHLSTKSSK